MKICFLADAKATHIKRWSEYFANKGHEVHLLTLNPDVLLNYTNVILHLIRKKPKRAPTLISRLTNLLPFVIRIKRLINEIKPDILHAHSVGGYGWLGILTGFHPLLITPWGNDVLIDIEKSKIERFLTKIALQRADLVHCDGENIREVLVKLGVAPEKIEYICFGVDTIKFSPQLRDEALRNRLFSPDVKIVISTRFLTQVHDVGTLIKAIPTVKKEVPEARFIIIGDGPESEYLIGLCKSLDIIDIVKFTGRILESDLPAYMASADVYVSTSLSESGLAASTAEAMACGLAVINTDTGDIGKWIKNGEGGFIIPVRDPIALAQRAIYLLRNEEARKKFGEVSRSVIEERNNYFKEMAKMEEIYERLASHI